MTRFVINHLIVAFVLFFLTKSVLSENLTAIDPKYIGSDARKNTCVLSAFNATVSIHPSNESFSGYTFQYLNPITSEAQLTKCEPFIQHYYRFEAQFNDTPRVAMLSVGFESHYDLSVDLMVKYVELLCNNPKHCIDTFGKSCKSEDIGELAQNNCLKMSVKYPLGYIHRNYSYQCSHNWGAKNLKDIGYFDERAVLRGTIDITLDYFRIDITDTSDHFNPIKYCLMDWILDFNTILIASVTLVVIIALIAIKCLIDCRRVQNRKTQSDSKRPLETQNSLLRKKSEKKVSEEDSNQPIEL